MYEYLEKIAAKRSNDGLIPVGIGAGIGAAGMAGLAGATAYGLPRLANRLTPTPGFRVLFDRGAHNPIPRFIKNRPSRFGKSVISLEERRNSVYGGLVKRLGSDKRAKAAVLGAALLIGAGIGAGAGYLRSRRNQ